MFVSRDIAPLQARFSSSPSGCIACCACCKARTGCLHRNPSSCGRSSRSSSEAGACPPRPGNNERRYCSEQPKAPKPKTDTSTYIRKNTNIKWTLEPRLIRARKTGPCFNRPTDSDNEQDSPSVQPYPPAQAVGGEWQGLFQNSGSRPQLLCICSLAATTFWSVDLY